MGAGASGNYAGGVDELTVAAPPDLAAAVADLPNQEKDALLRLVKRGAVPAEDGVDTLRGTLKMTLPYHSAESTLDNPPLAGGFRKGDKVAALADDPSIGVVKGDIGTVLGMCKNEELDQPGKRLCVVFGQSPDVKYVDTAGDTILFRRKENGKLEYHVNGEPKVIDLTSLEFQNGTIFLKGITAGSWPSQRPEARFSEAYSTPVNSSDAGRVLALYDNQKLQEEAEAANRKAAAIREAEAAIRKALAEGKPLRGNLRGTDYGTLRGTLRLGAPAKPAALPASRPASGKVKKREKSDWRGGEALYFDRHVVNLVRNPGELWGLSIDDTRREVCEEPPEKIETALGRWNRENPERAVVNGDILIMVDKDAGEDFDKFFGDPEALSHELVFIRLRRREPPPSPPPEPEPKPEPTATKFWDNIFEAAEAPPSAGAVEGEGEAKPTKPQPQIHSPHNKMKGMGARLGATGASRLTSKDATKSEKDATGAREPSRLSAMEASSQLLADEEHQAASAAAAAPTAAAA